MKKIKLFIALCASAAIASCSVQYAYADINASSTVQLKPGKHLTHVALPPVKPLDLTKLKAKQHGKKKVKHHHKK